MRILMILLGLLGLLAAPRPSLAQDGSKDFQAFLSDFPPGNDVRPFHGELSPTLKEHVHPRLIEFWQRVGFGSFGNGFITFLDPREAETMLARWLLLQQPDPTRVPIARTAFGGQATKASVGRGDCLVHQEILLQLALSSGASRK